MNISKLAPIASQTFGRSLLIVRKFSPEILITVGVVGVVVSAVMASKSTLKLEPIVSMMEIDVAYAKTRKLEEPISDYPVEEYSKDIIKAYSRGVFGVVKLYGPSVTLGLTSIVCIVGAHGIMSKRNMALAAAYKAVESSFSEYRKRVVSELGLDKDTELRLGAHEVEVVDEETGKTTTAIALNPAENSQYARFFDESSSQWKKEAHYNQTFLRCQQQFANDLLLSRGHLFLNEVYDSLGIDRTPAGSVVGWVVSKKGDNFVDFNIFDAGSNAKRAFVNGWEKSIFLDFNVDGVIYDQI